MSAPVDVLAVMGIAATTLHAENYSGTANSMDAARAAVAELIEAVSAERAVGHRKYSEIAEARKRTDAALARVKGGAA